MLKLRTLFLGLMLLCGAAVWAGTAEPVYACWPVSPDAWFLANLYVPPLELPEGVGVYASSPQRLDRQLYLQIKNESDSDVILLTGFAQNQLRQQPLGADNVRLTPNLLDSFSEGSLLISPQNRHELTFRRDVMLDRTASIDQFLPKGVEDFNVYEDTRPGNPELPAEQQFSLALLVNDQVYFVPVTLFYELNTTYEAGRYARGIRACNNLYRSGLELRLFLYVEYFIYQIESFFGMTLAWSGLTEWRWLWGCLPVLGLLVWSFGLFSGKAGGVQDRD